MNSRKQLVDGRIKPGRSVNKRSRDHYFLDGPRATEDFMSERDQGVAEEREPFY
jgi:virulence-associated protein VagC